MVSQVDEVKQKTDIVELIGGYIRLDRAGRNYKGLCPFHNERTPSFMVNPDRGTWRCFGCGEHGDVISFLEKHDNLTFPEALEQLADKAGVVLIKDAKFDKLAARKQRLYELMNLSAEYYAYLLHEHALGSEARDYLKSRGIDEGLAKKYRLGYAPDSWQSLTTFMSKKGFSGEELDLAGMVSRSARGRQYDRFRNRLMFTVTDTMGRVVGFSGRSLGDDGAKYLNSPDGPLFHKGRLLYGLEQAREGIRKSDRVILVEGNVDVLSVHKAGTEEVVAPLGTALTEDQVRLLSRYTENVYVAFDQDRAGQEAIRKAVDLLRQADVNIRIVALKGGADPDEVVRNNPKNWLASVEESIDVVDFYIGWVGKRFDIGTDRGKGQAADVLLPLFILNNTNKQRESLMYNRISRLLDLDEKALRERARALYREAYYEGKGSGHRRQGSGGLAGDVSKLSAQGQKSSTVSSASSSGSEAGRPRAPQDPLVEYLLGMLLSLPLEELPVSELKRGVDGLEVGALAEPDRVLFEAFGRMLEGEVATVARWYELAPKDLESRMDELGTLSSGTSLTLSGTIGVVVDDVGSLSDRLEELPQVVREINRLYLKKQLDELSRSLKQAELVDKDRVPELQRQHIALSQKLAQLSKAG